MARQTCCLAQETRVCPAMNPEGGERQPVPSRSTTARILEKARQLLLDQVGWIPVGPADDFHHFQNWLEEGMHGEMLYLSKHSEARKTPLSIKQDAKTILMALVNYRPDDSHSNPTETGGKVARYARGPDYHEMLWEKLGSLGKFISELVPGCSWRAVADSAPLLERGFAARCGLGWIGKNTLLVNRKLGSYTVLGALLLSHELPANLGQIEVADSCGTCTRCVEACPTQAIRPGRQLDARQCISYWTIEKRGPIGHQAGSLLHGWLFGCDICQEVCPWNRKAPLGKELGQHEDFATLDCVAILECKDDDIRAMIRHTALTRTKPTGLRRNALWILGTIGNRNHLQVIRLHTDSQDEGVREAAIWAERVISGRFENQ